jgi:hypothetical protein
LARGAGVALKDLQVVVLDDAAIQVRSVSTC